MNFFLLFWLLNFYLNVLVVFLTPLFVGAFLLLRFVLFSSSFKVREQSKEGQLIEATYLTLLELKTTSFDLSELNWFLCLPVGICVNRPMQKKQGNLSFHTSQNQYSALVSKKISKIFWNNCKRKYLVWVLSLQHRVNQVHPIVSTGQARFLVKGNHIKTAFIISVWKMDESENGQMVTLKKASTKSSGQERF